MNDLETDLSKKKKSGPIYALGRKSSGEDVSSDDSVSFEDFKIVRFISKGTFGSVFLAFLPNNNNYYAIKCMSKNELL
jgi:serine/threonine protein kinase